MLQLTTCSLIATKLSCTEMTKMLDLTAAIILHLRAFKDGSTYSKQKLLKENLS